MGGGSVRLAMRDAKLRCCRRWAGQLGWGCGSHAVAGGCKSQEGGMGWGRVGGVPPCLWALWCGLPVPQVLLECVAPRLPSEPTPWVHGAAGVGEGAKRKSAARL